MKLLVCLAIPIVTSLLLQGCGGGGGDTPSPSPGPKTGTTTTTTTTTCMKVTGGGPDPDLTLLQWNPHYQCGQSPACSGAMTGLATERLQSEQVDFANFIEFPPSWTPPAPWKTIQKYCGKDLVSLVYNSGKWTAVDNMKRDGCIIGSDRPYIVQQFDGPDGSQVVVIGAHYDHVIGIGDLGSDTRAVQEASKVTRLVLIADTNRYVRGVTTGSDHFCDISKEPGSSVVCQTNAEILDQILGVCSVNVISAKYLASCCSDTVHHTDDPFINPYDRIASNFGSSMETKLYDDPTPTWVANSFHKAILGRLSAKQQDPTVLA